MITDLFPQVGFNDGEELTFQDLNLLQTLLSTRLNEQILARLIPGIFPGLATKGDPQFQGELGLSLVRAVALKAGGAYPYCIGATNAVRLATGTLFQVAATADDVSMTPFWFDGTTGWTIDAGDATNPRVDLLQMSLSYVDDTPTSVSFLQDGVKASLDMATITTHANTVYQAKVAGISGDNISISYQKRTSGSGVTYSENGNAVLIQYEDAVSTNADVEAQVIANATVIEIKSTGTGATVLHDPADTTVYTHLTGGADQMIIPQTLNKRNRVQCLLNVKKGTPAASPAYPAPDTGAVVVGAVVVGAGYLTTTQIIEGVDTAGANAVLCDQRLPLGVKVIRLRPKDMTYLDADWTIATNKGFLTATGASKPLYATCSIAGPAGLVLGVALQATAVSGMTAKLRRSNASDILSDVSSQLVQNDSNPHYRFASLASIENNSVATAGPTVVANSNGIGPPVWTSGYRMPKRPFESSDSDAGGQEWQIDLHLTSAGADIVSSVTFFIAEGV